MCGSPSRAAVVLDVAGHVVRAFSTSDELVIVLLLCHCSTADRSRVSRAEHERHAEPRVYDTALHEPVAVFDTIRTEIDPPVHERD